LVSDDVNPSEDRTGGFTFLVGAVTLPRESFGLLLTNLDAAMFASETGCFLGWNEGGVTFLVGDVTLAFDSSGLLVKDLGVKKLIDP